MNFALNTHKNKIIKILIVEDECILAINLQENLESWGYTVIDIADSHQAAIEKATKLHPDLILMDINLHSEVDGIQAAQEIWNDLYIPIIYVTGYSDNSTIERATDTFAFGYVLKPVREQELYAAIQTALHRYEREQFLSTMLAEMKSEVSKDEPELGTKYMNEGATVYQSMYQQLQTANQELQKLANLDGLTQIANRRRFDEYLHIEWHRLQRKQIPLSLILLDIDFFKRYNDTYGHLAGDDCLRQVANALKRVVQRPADLVARYGGEEFVIILPHTEYQGAIHVAGKILQAVRDLAIPHAQSEVCAYVTLSIGVISTIPNSEYSPRDLIEKADKALYTAKQQGRNCIR